MQSVSTHLRILLFIFFAVLIWSGIRPHDYFTWVLEVSPAVTALVLLSAIYKRFRFTNFAYTLILLHCIVLMVGGHYTYAEVPLFNWIRDYYGLQRNSYDGVGHFMQGFVPAIIAREVLLKASPLKRGKWLTFVVICIVLAFSAFYELIEWWISLLTGSKGDAFLGTQGDIWDTQKDMVLCLAGSILSLLTLSKAHDRALAAQEKGKITQLQPLG
jgi:putative membrane protein